jgi:hypothetical protein
MPKINDPGEIAGVLASARTIAVVGCSPDERRPSHAIASYLLRAGFDVIPVNPAHGEILGRKCYPSLAAVPATVALDVVDVFRRSEAIGAVADEAIARGARFFWMQDGVVNDAAAARLVAAGIGVAMDRCIYRDHLSVAAGAPL